MNTDSTADRLEALLAAVAEEQARGVKLGHTCAVHVHDEWVPQNEHHIWPLGMGGPDQASNKVTLCMNGHGAVHAYLDLLVRHGEDPRERDNPAGGVPWHIAMHFGPKVRAVAFQGWVQAGRPRRPVAPDREPV